MERNKRSYHVQRLVAMRLIVKWQLILNRNIFACFTLTFPTMRSYSTSKNSKFFPWTQIEQQMLTLQRRILQFYENEGILK